jgi:hypothetical protein
VDAGGVLAAGVVAAEGTARAVAADDAAGVVAAEEAAGVVPAAVAAARASRRRARFVRFAVRATDLAVP